MEKILLAIIIAVFVAFSYLYIKSDMEWQRWAKQHCVITKEESGNTYTGGGINSSGQYQTMTLYTSGKTTYKCDDGTEYVR